MKRLIFCIKQAALLTETEATAVLRLYRAGDNFSSEAANHYGGNKNVIKDAIKRRHAIRKVFKNFKKEGLIK